MTTSWIHSPTSQEELSTLKASIPRLEHILEPLTEVLISAFEWIIYFGSFPKI